MANNVQFNASLPSLRSLMGHASPSLQELVDEMPVLHTIDRASLLANVQDDMAALLASVMRRQGSSRASSVRDRDNVAHDEVPDTSRQDDFEKVRTLLRAGDAGWQATYDLARTLFPDPADLALLLASLREDLDLEEKIRAEIKQALAELVAEHGHDTLAPGLNIKGVIASIAARTGLTAASLRQTYDALLAGGSGEMVTYRYLIDAFGFARRGLALDFLEQALAADMAAETPSRPKDTYQPLLELLFQFRLLRSADALMVAAARQHRRGPARHSGPLHDLGLMDKAAVELLLAALNDPQQAQQQFSKFLQDWRGVAVDRQIAPWAQGVLRAISDVPTELFCDLAYREALLVRLSDTISSIFYGPDQSHKRLGQPHG